MAAPEGVLERAEELTERIAPRRAPKKRMLLIANPYATTVSARLKNLIVYALEGRYEVDAVDTEERNHATVLCREAAHEGYDLVVAFGGDGTVNEVANGLIGSDTPLSCLPGGATNVFTRILGIPNDVVDATEHLLRLADDFHPRRIDTGLMDGRHFVFASGVGLDASVVERVDSHPRLKARLGEYYFTYAAVATFSRTYLFNAPRVKLEVSGRSVEGVTVIVQNADPFTYFGRRPIRICQEESLDSGSLSLAVLRRASPLEIPTIIPRAFSGRPGSVLRHRRIEGFERVRRARVTSSDGRPFPVQVDGDHVGHMDELRYGIAPLSLAVVA